MYFRTKQYNMPYKCLIILTFFMFCLIFPCQAGQEITASEPAQQNIQRLALAGDKVAFLRSTVQPLTPGQAGRKAYTFAAQEMAKRSPQGEQLEPEIKEMLYLYFKEDLVDRVFLHWETPLLEKWEYGGYSITLRNADTEAQTYGYDIYIKYSKAELDTLRLMTLLIHHMTHVRQFKELGESLENFGEEYFTKYYQEVSEVYENNQMELEASLNVKEFLTSVIAIRK